MCSIELLQVARFGVNQLNLSKIKPVISKAWSTRPARQSARGLVFSKDIDGILEIYCVRSHVGIPT